MKKKQIKTATLFVALLCFAWCVSAQNKPNIILIVADDMGYGELGCYGQQMMHTPHIDSLAAGGMRFTDYYAGCSVCAPSRESLLTGFHTGHTAIRGNFRLAREVGNLPMAPDHRTIAEYLKTQGYRTALFGKWGVGDPSTGPNTRGFDYSVCYIDQVKAHNYYPPYLWENDKKILLSKNQGGAKGTYSHDFFVDKTLDYLRKNKDNQPFFLYLPYTIPHGDYSLPPDTPYTQKNWPKHFQVYATMVSKLDRDVGRIVQLLREKGMLDNTVIIFTSDNGANAGPAKFFKGNGIFRGAKLSLYEGGIREPLIVYWHGKIKPRQVSDHLTAAWDFLPTLCQLAGTPPPAHTDGISFLPALMEAPQRDHPYLYWEYYHYNYNWEKAGNDLPRNWLESKAVRMGKWKAVKNKIFKDKQAKIELYDLERDPSERHNVAGEHPDIIENIRRVFDTASQPDPPHFPYKGNK
jgi:arylsulfatase A-like enzyme